MASEFDTLEELRADLTKRIVRVKRAEQLYVARDKALAALVAAADVPAPEGAVKDDTNSRKQSMVDQLERMGATLAEYLTSESQTEEDLDNEIDSAARKSVRIQLLLDAFADREEIQVTDEEFGHEIVDRANQAGVAPQQYYDQLSRAGLATAVYGDVRRGKALARFARAGDDQGLGRGAGFTRHPQG